MNGSKLNSRKISEIEMLNSLCRHHRRALSPAFHFDAVKSFIPLFVKKTNELLEIWGKIDDKPVFAQPTWMPKYTLDVLSKLCYNNMAFLLILTTFFNFKAHPSSDTISELFMAMKTQNSTHNTLQLTMASSLCKLHEFWYALQLTRSSNYLKILAYSWSRPRSSPRFL